MNQRSPVGAAVVILVMATACAPGGTLPGVLPSAETGQPVQWFAQEWGPFDSDLRGIGADGRPRPLVLVDGEQVTYLVGDWATPSEPIPGHSAADIRRIEVIKCREGAGYFGEAGNRGVVLVLTRAYQGPMPVSPLPSGDEFPPCVPEPQFAPLEYFAQLGPFDPDLNLRRHSDEGGLILLDGRQVEVVSEAQMADLKGLVIAQMAGRPGLILTFSQAWEGPLPERDWTRTEVCRGGDA
jgi:hypothetical protein